MSSAREIDVLEAEATYYRHFNAGATAPSGILGRPAPAHPPTTRR
ncbi:MAG: hypothetical protein ACYCXW_04260 [Solirubrobacteraceae bacterium]